MTAIPANVSNHVWRCGRFTLECHRPHVVAIVNLTDDSFSGDGLAGQHRQAIDLAWQHIEHGARMVDIGAESSRPGATAIAADLERARLTPVLKALADAPVPISVDTTKPEIMRLAIDLGCSVINDINALQSPGALDAVVRADVGLCLMHRRGTPTTMQQQPTYDDVVAEVCQFLSQHLNIAQAAGIDRERLSVDPGFGFGKTLTHNVTLLGQLATIVGLGRPVWLGVSRKSMWQHWLGRALDARLPGCLAATLFALEQGARLIRTHDVQATLDALTVWQTLAHPQ